MEAQGMRSYCCRSAARAWQCFGLWVWGAAGGLRLLALSPVSSLVEQTELDTSRRRFFL